MRSLPPAIKLAFAARTAEPLALDAVVDLDDEKMISPSLLRALGDEQLELFVHEDLRRLLSAFAECTDVSRFRVRLERVDDDMCEKLHTDSVPMRLLCTYAGVGTEWVDAADADRSRLGPSLFGHAEANASILRRPDALQRASVGDVLLLKGSKSVDSEGAIHRSSPASPRSRILLRIDMETSP